ncbi:MAG TPA: molybdopterin converting factor subunit 1 [Thermoflexales bacterium]|nr:molybdopterin converting factor subunit 1 [Thermoflexales bacterium]HQZ21430.1 molybdopterin converting factor subunit 1 [Thermoflexales bacterium]
MKVLLFATLKERAGKPTIDVALDGPLSVAAFRKSIAQQHPALAPLLDQALVAVNQDFAFEEELIQPADEVAIFPPVSGGAPDAPPTLAQVDETPIDLNALQRFVTTDEDGSVVFFIGTVRGKTGHDQTTRLEYESYQAMALAKMRQVADEMREKFPGVHGIALHQRLGQMDVREPTIAVVCSASHRGSGAFEAARYGIDRIKQIVPVWKKETRPDGSSWIEGDYTPKTGD